MRTEEDRAEAALNDQIFDHARDLGKERVGEVGHNDADILGQPPVLVHRVDVGLIVIGL